MKLFRLLLLLSFSGAGASIATEPIQIRSRLEALLVPCQDAVRKYPDYAACPMVRKYQFRTLTLDKALDFLKADELYDPRPASADKAIGSIEESLSLHYDSLKSIEEESGGTGGAKRFHKFSHRFVKSLRSAAKGRMVYEDPDTYWAPSVNARGLFLIDLRRNTLTIILHGDTDG